MRKRSLRFLLIAIVAVALAALAIQHLGLLHWLGELIHGR